MPSEYGFISYCTVTILLLEPKFMENAKYWMISIYPRKATPDSWISISIDLCLYPISYIYIHISIYIYISIFKVLMCTLYLHTYHNIHMYTEI